jgi:hypothetical protein
VGPTQAASTVTCEQIASPEDAAANEFLQVLPAMERTGNEPVTSSLQSRER